MARNRAFSEILHCSAGHYSSGGQKRPLTHADYDGWRSIYTPTLTRNGRFLIYSFMPQDGDGDLLVRDLKTGQERRESVGALPPLQMQPFAWGTGELVSFRNTEGVPLKAALYKPQNFDPKKKYPMLVYIYEGVRRTFMASSSRGPVTASTSPSPSATAISS